MKKKKIVIVLGTEYDGVASICAKTFATLARWYRPESNKAYIADTCQRVPCALRVYHRFSRLFVAITPRNTPGLERRELKEKHFEEGRKKVNASVSHSFSFFFFFFSVAYSLLFGIADVRSKSVLRSYISKQQRKCFLLPHTRLHAPMKK